MVPLSSNGCPRDSFPRCEASCDRAKFSRFTDFAGEEEEGMEAKERERKQRIKK